MRKVKFKYYHPAETRGGKGEWIESIGVFHQWGTDHIEFEAGPGNFSVAIIEESSGEIRTVLPGHVQFINESS